MESIHNVQILKPINRSNLRLMLGKAYYTNKQHLAWIFSKAKLAKHSDLILEKDYFSHQTPLIRK